MYRDPAAPSLAFLFAIVVDVVATRRVRCGVPVNKQGPGKAAITVVIAAALLVAGCYSGPEAARSTKPKPNTSGQMIAATTPGIGNAQGVDRGAGQGERLAVAMGLLKRWSPDSWELINRYDALKRVMNIGGSGIEGMITGTTERDIAPKLVTPVHETFHAYAKPAGRHRLRQMGEPGGFGAYEYYLDRRRSYFVRCTPTFPASEWGKTVPNDLRPIRFGTYIYPSSPTASTQQDGPYALLDELYAYYHGALAACEMFGYYKATAGDDLPPWRDYRLSVIDTVYGQFDFRYFIVGYMLYAKKNHPDVYREVLGNREYRRAYAAVARAGWEMEQRFSNHMNDAVAILNRKRLQVMMYEYVPEKFGATPSYPLPVTRECATPAYREMDALLMAE